MSGEYPSPRYRAARRHSCIVTISSSSLVTRCDFKFVHAADQIGEGEGGEVEICGQQHGTKDRRGFSLKMFTSTFRRHQKIHGLKEEPEKNILLGSWENINLLNLFCAYRETEIN